jgi:hypothetical protein
MFHLLREINQFCTCLRTTLGQEKNCFQLNDAFRCWRSDLIKAVMCWPNPSRQYNHSLLV